MERQRFMEAAFTADADDFRRVEENLQGWQLGAASFFLWRAAVPTFAFLLE